MAVNESEHNVPAEGSPADSRSSAAERRHDTASQRRVKYGLNLAVLLFATIIIVIAINWFAAASSFRWDLTATRAYSLSPQTQQILASLEEPVTLTLIFSEQNWAAERRQVEDVLREFETRSENVQINRIDPTDPSTIAEYTALTERLRSIFAEEIGVYEGAIAEGVSQLEDLATFVSGELELLQPALSGVDPTDQMIGPLVMVQRVLTGAPANLELLIEQIQDDLSTDEAAGKVFPDWEGAASTIRATATELETSFRQIVQLYTQAAGATNLPPRLADYLASADERFTTIADQLADLAERITDLDPLEIGPILIAMRNGNAVLASNSTNAVVIPYEDLFPRRVSIQDGESAIGDRRFAGEQVIAAGIRRLTLEEQPVVVFAFAEAPPNPRMPPQPPPDFRLAAQHLEDFGFDVRRWNVASARPEISDAAGKPVWIIVTDQPNQPMLGPASSGLADAANSLVAEGENVLMSFWPSFSPGFGQEDFWNEVTEPFGVRADTARVIFESIQQPGEQDIAAPGKLLTDFNRKHPVGAAVDGLPTIVEYPVPLEFTQEPDAAGDEVSAAADDADAPTGEPEDGEPDDGEAPPRETQRDANRTVILAIEPTDRIFASDQWTMGDQNIEPPAEPDTEPYKIVIAVERPVEGGSQRAVIVGGGSWYWSPVLMQRRIEMAEGIIAPTYPGNIELFTSSVLWLATLDEMIAPSPAAQSIPRVGTLSDAARTAWGWLLIAGLPLLSLAVGVGVWMSRRG